MNVQKNARKMVWLGILVAVAALQFVGCTVGPKYHRPPVETPPSYKEMGNWKTAQPSDQNLAAKWWEIFQDPQLNDLEGQIEVSNQNLKAAFALYQQARAVLR